MRFGVRSKLFVVSLLLLAVVGLVTGPWLEAELRQSLERRVEDELVRECRAMAMLLEGAPELQAADQRIEHVDPVADRLGAVTRARVTIIAADGRVLGDSELGLDALHTVEPHGDRPEVRAAIASHAQGRAVTRRYSTTLRVEMLYVAASFGRGQRPAGVVRLALPLHDVDEAVRRMRIGVALALLGGLVVAMAMSGLASHLVSRRLRELVAHVRARRARGAQLAGSARGGDELGVLAGSLAHLERELEVAVEGLTSERDRLETILESMHDAVLALDAEGRVTLANPAARELLHAREPIEGQSLLETTRTPALAEAVARASEGQVTAVEVELDGREPRRALVRAAPLRATRGVVVVLHDVTEMRRLETMRRDFVANVSHELRTPVSVIRANAETLLDGALADPAVSRSFVDAIDRSAERLTLLIADLLDLARVESGSYELRLEPLALAPVAAEVVSMVADIGRRREVALSIDVDPELRVVADASGLEQILLNLLDNAVKVVPDRGHVELRARAQAGEVRIEVEDDGPGIDARSRDRIFERFYRVDRGRSRDHGGTGLGLAIVKHLAVAMRGSVGVDRAPERGSVFWVVLPRDVT